MFGTDFNKKWSTVSRILLPAGILKSEKYNLTYSWTPNLKFFVQY
jgi:hypothetical protein